MSQSEKFISKIANKAVQIGRKYGIPPSVIIVQAALETGWGSKVVGNNLFNIKRKSQNEKSYCTRVSNEYENGKPIARLSLFRKYLSIDDSIEDYAKFITTNSRYKAALKYPKDAEKYITEIWKAGYATDPDYVSKVMNIIINNDILKYDKEV